MITIMQDNFLGLILMPGGADAAILPKYTASKAGRRKVEKQSRAFHDPCSY